MIIPMDEQNMFGLSFFLRTHKNDHLWIFGAGLWRIGWIPHSKSSSSPALYCRSWMMHRSLSQTRWAFGGKILRGYHMDGQTSASQLFPKRKENPVWCCEFPHKMGAQVQPQHKFTALISGHIYSLMWDPPNAINHPQNRHFYGWYKPSPNRCTYYGLWHWFSHILSDFSLKCHWTLELGDIFAAVSLSDPRKSPAMAGSQFWELHRKLAECYQDWCFFWSGCSRNNWVFVPSPKFHGKNMGV